MIIPIIVFFFLVNLMTQKNTNANYVYVDDDYVKRKKLTAIQCITTMLVAMTNRQFITFI